MSLIPPDTLLELRTNSAIVPDSFDTITEIWRLPQGSGQAVDALGDPVSTGTGAEGRFLYDSLFGRWSQQGPGQQKVFGEQTETSAQWNVALPILLPNNTDYRVVLNDDQLCRGEPGWAAHTAYLENQVIGASPSNGYQYRCIVPGASGATQPVWPVADNFEAGVWSALAPIPTGTVIRIYAPASAPQVLLGVRYKATVGGTTGATQPVWPTAALGTVGDGGVTWQLCQSVQDGGAVWQLDRPLFTVQVVKSNYGSTLSLLLVADCQEVDTGVLAARS